jgi:hypothetical protein
LFALQYDEEHFCCGMLVILRLAYGLYGIIR